MFIAFRLKPGRDDNLIDWITDAGEGDRSYHIRQAIRQGLIRQAPAPSSLAFKIEAKQFDNIEPIVNEADLEAVLDAWE